jgi:hypothetical protein
MSAGGIDRNQGKDIASLKMARQDIGGFITDGGFFSWNVVADELSWTGTIRIRRAGGIGFAAIASGSLGSISAPDDCAYIVLNRDAAGGPYTMAKASIDSAVVNADNILVIGVRGSDDRFYLRDGTILGDGETKKLGQTNVLTDRYDGVGDGTVGPFALGFSYVVGSDQLAVWVGGVLQTLGTHYTESSTTEITFVAGEQPGIGELITAINVAGGEGPAGAGGATNMQEAFDGGHVVNTTTAGPIRLQNAVPTTHLLEFGTPANPDRAFVDAAGSARFGKYLSLKDPGGTGDWGFVVDGDDLILVNIDNDKAFRFLEDGGLEHGEYAHPAGPFSSGGGPLRWTEYAGTFASGGPETVSTGIPEADIKGVLLKAYNASTVRHQLMEISLGSAGSRAVYVSLVGSNVIMSGDSSGTLAVGSQLRTEAYILTVFHE